MVIITPKTSEILVESLMESLPTIREDIDVYEMIKLMKSERTTFLPVVDNAGRVVGGVFDYNLLKLVKQEPISPLSGAVWTDTVDKQKAKKSVSEIMDSKIVTVLPEDTLDAALKTMNSNDARMLVVADKDKKFMGVLRIRTVFEKLLSDAQ